MKNVTGTGLSDITWVAHLTVEGKTAYNLISASESTVSTVTEEALRSLYRATGLPDADVDYNIGDFDLEYLEGSPLGFMLTLELPGPLGVFIEEYAELQGVLFEEAIVMLIEDGILKIA